MTPLSSLQVYRPNIHHGKRGNGCQKNCLLPRCWILPRAVERVWYSIKAVHVSLCTHMEVNFGCDVCQLADLNATSVLRPWVAVAEQPVAHCCIRVWRTLRQVMLIANSIGPREVNNLPKTPRLEWFFFCYLNGHYNFKRLWAHSR